MYPIGLLLLSFQPLFIGIGSFVFDFNETHVYNPNWPPHARFHNGQTMSMAASLAAATLWYTHRTPHLSTVARKKDSLLAAALFGSMYCFTGLTAILYPGAKGIDPEFGVDTFPQKFVFGIPLVVNWVGYLLAVRWVGEEERKRAPRGKKGL